MEPHTSHLCESIADVVDVILHPALAERMAQRPPWLAREVANALTQDIASGRCNVFG